MRWNGQFIVDLSLSPVTNFCKDPEYTGDITFGLDHRLPYPRSLKGCQLFSSEGMKPQLDLNRVHFYQISLCIAGSTTTALSMTDYEVRKNVLYVCYPGLVNQIRQINPGWLTYNVAFTQDFYLTGQQPLMMLYKFPFLQYDGIPAFELTDGQAAVAVAQFRQLNEAYLSEYTLREDVLRIGIGQLLHVANQRYEQLQFDRTEYAPVGTVLTNRFIYLICEHHLHNRRIGDYAERLAVTPNHLNETVKATTGKTCSELIKTMLILEAKIMLRQTDRSVSEIADEFNFSDVPHFTKYFKKHTALTPVEFRNQP